MRSWLREPSAVPTVLQGVVTCTNPVLEVLATDVLTVRDIVITDVGASGSLIEFCRGTVTTLLLTVVLPTLLSSSDALDIGSSNMGVLWHTFFVGAVSIGAAVLSEGNVNCTSAASSLMGLTGIYPASSHDLDFSICLREHSLTC